MRRIALVFLFACSTPPRSPPDAANACAIARYQWCPTPPRDAPLDAAPASDAVDASRDAR